MVNARCEKPSCARARQQKNNKRQKVFFIFTPYYMHHLFLCINAIPESGLGITT